MTPSLALAAIARKLRMDPEIWVQGRMARNRAGMDVGATAIDACAWCAVGLVLREREPRPIELCSYLERAINSEFVGEWNDADGRTVAQVADAFERAAEIAKGEGR